MAIFISPPSLLILIMPGGTTIGNAISLSEKMSEKFSNHMVPWPNNHILDHKGNVNQIA
jgi:hypothetical protein